MASSVYSAYAQSAGEINNNLASFREDVDNVKAVNRQIVQKNKQLLQDAYTKNDLDALSGLGEEIAVRQFKKYGGKALSYVDKRFLGGRIEGDTEKVMNKLRSKASDLFGRAKGKIGELEGKVQDRVKTFTGDEDGEVEMNETGGGSGGAEGGETIEADGTPTSDALDDVDRVDETDIGDMSFDDFMNQFSVPRTESGDIDFDRAGEQTQMGMEDARGQSLRQTEGKSMEDGDNETGEETKEDDPVDDETGESGGNLGSEGDTALKDAEGDLADTGVDEGIDEGVGAGLEGVGTALDTTGIGAIVGVPLQIAGAVLEGGAIYEAGKGVVDWVEQLFGKKPDAPSVKKVAIPNAPKTLAQRGMMITPTMDTLDTQPSFAGGW